MIAWCTEGFQRYPWYFPETLVLIAFAIHYHRYIPMDICMHLLFSWSFLVALFVTRCPKLLFVVPRILWAYCLAVLCHLNTPTDNSRTYRVSAHPQLIQVFHKSVQNTIQSSENPQEPFCSWNSCLLALWLILSLVILLTSIVIIILSPLIQFVANARNPQTDPRIHPSDSDVILNMRWFSPIKLSSIVPLSLLNLSILD